MQTWVQAVVGCTAAFFSSTLLAQANPPAPATAPEKVAAGKNLYIHYCARCHGFNMATGSAAVFDLRTFPKEDKPRFVESVTKGKRAMPAWSGTLKENDIELLWAYVSAPR